MFGAIRARRARKLRLALVVLGLLALIAGAVAAEKSPKGKKGTAGGKGAGKGGGKGGKTAKGAHASGVRAKVLEREGIEALQHRNFALALDKFNMAISLDPGYVTHTRSPPHPSPDIAQGSRAPGARARGRRRGAASRIPDTA
jgi:hypothetical protein